MAGPFVCPTLKVSLSIVQPCAWGSHPTRLPPLSHRALRWFAAFLCPPRARHTARARSHSAPDSPAPRGGEQPRDGGVIHHHERERDPREPGDRWPHHATPRIGLTGPTVTDTTSGVCAMRRLAASSISA